jgi:hypothetical protein
MLDFELATERAREVEKPVNQGCCILHGHWFVDCARRQQAWELEVQIQDDEVRHCGVLLAVVQDVSQQIGIHLI